MTLIAIEWEGEPIDCDGCGALIETGDPVLFDPPVDVEDEPRVVHAGCR